jgi:hypothetical protein
LRGLNDFAASFADHGVQSHNAAVDYSNRPHFAHDFSSFLSMIVPESVLAPEPPVEHLLFC